MVREVEQLIEKIDALNHFMSKATNKCFPFFKLLRKISNFKYTPKCKEAFARLKEYLSQPPFLSKLKPEEFLYLYLAVSDVVMTMILICEEKGVQHSMYYVNHSMALAEMRYPNLVKLALALLVAL